MNLEKILYYLLIGILISCVDQIPNDRLIIKGEMEVVEEFDLHQVFTHRREWDGSSTYTVGKGKKTATWEIIRSKEVVRLKFKDLPRPLSYTYTSPDRIPEMESLDPNIDEKK